MYGQIHCCVRALVLEKFGQEAWDKILEVCKLDEVTAFMTFHYYPDTETLALVGAVSEVSADFPNSLVFTNPPDGEQVFGGQAISATWLPVDSVLEAFGEYFFEYCCNVGYDKMLQTLGDNIATFIQNLDSLHALLALSYTNIEAPSFRCETNPDGTLMLHYYSYRQGMYPVVIGVVKAASRELFNTSVELKVVEKHDTAAEGLPPHVVFHVTYVMDADVKSRLDVRSVTDSPNPTIPAVVDYQYPEKLRISPTNFCNVLPYHVVFDSDLKVVQAGVKIQKLCPQCAIGTLLTESFTLAHPLIKFTYKNILSFVNAVFMLSVRKGVANELHNNDVKPLVIKGQMMSLDDDLVMFIGSPRLSSLNELLERGMHLSDIPIFDVTRELVLLNQQRIAEIEVSKQLDETTAKLKITGQALEREKAKTETLLEQMLPRKVADQLKEGKTVEAEKFQEGTILFSDIVTFTDIAAASTPMDIVNMLNDMYSRFDKLTTEHDVYKVETIGDAYMVVGGVPERTEDHAERVALMGLAMIEAASQVKSPVTGLPLKIRVGVHSGPVVAGVVGDKMPRYCLFGDTVNTASRMESHGVPAMVHLSPFTYEKLVNKGFSMEPRGATQIKGKGIMNTQWLIGKFGSDKEKENSEMFERYLQWREDCLNSTHVEKGGDNTPKEKMSKITPPPTNGLTPTSSGNTIEAPGIGHTIRQETERKRSNLCRLM